MRVKVYCPATNPRAITTRFGPMFCDWKGGWRRVENADKPCPTCGGVVVVTDRRRP